MKRTSSVSEWLVRTTSRMRRSVARAGVGSGYNVLESGEVRPRPAFARPIAELSLPFPRAVLILSMVFLSIIAFRLMRAPISLLALPTRIVEVPVPVEYRPSIRDLISRSSQEYGLPEVIVRGVAGIESQWNAQSTRYESRHAKRAAALHPNDATAQRLAASSIGIMQVMGWQLGKEHPGKLFEVEYNIQQGTPNAAAALIRSLATGRKRMLRSGPRSSDATMVIA